MKVLALSTSPGGCEFYRLAEPARVASDLGVNVEVSLYVDVEATLDTSTSMTTVHEIHSDVDLIVIQRPLDNMYVSLIEQAKRQGIATIVELDDDFEMLHTKNFAHHGTTSHSHAGVDWLKKACELADHVTISTPALEKYGRGKSTILRNCVPESIFDITPVYELNREPVTIGWTGTTQVHPFDLQETRGAIGKVAKDNHLGITIVGDGVDVQRFLELDSETPFKATGWLSLDVYYEALRDAMDIGIVPLEMSPFNHAKSSLKGLEMAALGIPFVASPTQEYERFELYGVGKTATSAREWTKHLQKWIDRPLTRDSDARKYREIVYNENTIERNASEWVDTWERTIQLRKSLL